MTRQRGSTNRNQRGSSYQRRARREWLVNTFGDGEWVDCRLRHVPDCWVAMTKWSVSVDRVHAGAHGGRYTRDNIQPACPPCQSHQGGKLGSALKANRKGTTR